jgi:hypothetical protein
MFLIFLPALYGPGVEYLQTIQNLQNTADYLLNSWVLLSIAAEHVTGKKGLTFAVIREIGRGGFGIVYLITVCPIMLLFVVLSANYTLRFLRSRLYPLLQYRCRLVLPPLVSC